LLLDNCLHALREACRKGAATLYFCEMVAARRAFAKWFCQHVGCGHGVLNGQVDTHASDWGHGMGRIADAQQTGPMPLPQAIRPNG
jgi:hypothetical protein